MECIDIAIITDSIDEGLLSFYKLRGSFISDTKLSCYVIKTISTESEIKIIAKGFKVLTSK